MPLPAGLPHTANGLAGGPAPTFGDVNHDGITDAVVQIAVQDGNGVSIEESVWIGAANGTAKQLGKPFLVTGRCGFTITSHKITPSGMIQVSGGGMGRDCASSGTGPAYTAQYKVINNQIVTVTAPPE